MDEFKILAQGAQAARRRAGPHIIGGQQREIVAQIFRGRRAEAMVAFLQKDRDIFEVAPVSRTGIGSGIALGREHFHELAAARDQRG